MIDLTRDFVLFLHMTVCILAAEYVLDDGVGMGRTFDGIGGLSGGGATSKLLVNYPEPQRSQILDYLFKPNFGAALQILKVEIGGDSQSTDGTESSHMHSEHDEDYTRGYEWWLMVEAKKRNPDIKLYGLSWAWPGWIGQGTQNPYINTTKTASYIIKWIQGANTHYNLTIDYIGIWNERSYSIQYNIDLRAALDRNGFTHIKIVTADGGWGVANDVTKYPKFGKTVDVIGVHYPGTHTTKQALATNKTLWSSEDYSTYNDDIGGGCWARLLNQNYVNGHMTSTISWNLIASYYNALPWKRSGLMTAVEPWSGHYDVESPIWISAHTTQFTEIGWSYLQHGSGVGHLKLGGSYVSLMCPCKKHFTMIIETMTHDHSICVRPRLPPYTVQPQNATFTLKNALSNITTLNVWRSRFRYNGQKSTFMENIGSVKVVDGQFTVHLNPDEVYTFTSRSGGLKGNYGDSPASKPFPLPYMDDFESYPLNSEAFNFAPQIGVWEVRDSGDPAHGRVNAQVVTQRPVDWCQSNPVIDNTNVTINVGGDFSWSHVKVTCDVYLPAGPDSAAGAVLGVRVHMSKGSCKLIDTPGIYFIMNTDSLMIVQDLEMKHVLVEMPHGLQRAVWHTVSLRVWGLTVIATIGDDIAISTPLHKPPKNGFVSYGTVGYGVAYFDNVLITEK